MKRKRIISTMVELEEILKKEAKRQYFIDQEVKKEIRKIFNQFNK